MQAVAQLVRLEVEYYQGKQRGGLRAQTGTVSVHLLLTSELLVQTK